MKRLARIFIFLVLLGAILEEHIPQANMTGCSHLTSLAYERVKTAAKPVINMLQNPDQIIRAVQENIQPFGDVLTCYGPIFWDRVTIALEFLTTQMEYGVSSVKDYFNCISESLSYRSWIKQ